MKSNILRKILALSLCAAITGLSAAALPSFVPDCSISAQAMDVYGDFSYTVSDNSVLITRYNGTDKNVTIPSVIDGKSVTAIAKEAFLNNISVTAVTIPYGVKSIGINAFKNCVSLTDINIPGSVTSIGSAAFFNCVSLSDITIPDSVTSIGSSAFLYCASLKSVNIPYSVTDIGDIAFSACKNLSNINVDKYNSNYSSVYGVLYDKNKTKLISCPAKLNYVVGMPDSLKRIEEYAFFGCTELQNIVIPSKVTYIGLSAFELCKKLSSVSLPNSLTTIGKDAFYSCESLTDIVIPDSVTLINYYAFYNCKSLKSVSLPNKLKNIYTGVFSGCSSLTNINIPDTVWNIEDAFTGCTSLSSIRLPARLTSLYGSFKDCTSLTSIILPENLPSVGSHTFEGCTSLKSVSIPNSVTSIGESAFERCSSLNKVNIPGNLNSIGRYAFKECESLTGIKIPGSLTELGYQALFNCKMLDNITVEDNNTNYSAVDNVLFSKDKTRLILCGVGKSGKYIIPDSVTAIDECAFLWCNKLTDITIPESVTSIEEKALNCSGSIKSINADTANPAFSSSDGVLFNKDKTRLIRYPAGKAGEYTVPKSVTLIGSYAFSDCNGLTVITFSSDARIADNAFLNCTGLKTIYGYKGSYAEKAANENGYDFIAIIPVSDIRLDKSSLTLGQGEQTRLKATVTPDNATYSSVAWRTSNSKVLRVDQKGNVSAVGTGVAWITVRSHNGKEKSCKITVKNAPEKITLTKGILTIGVGESYTIGSGIDAGAGCASRTYRTSNSSIVKMNRTDWNGVFVGVKPGVAYVTVKTYNGKESTCKVTVKEAPSNVTISKKNLTLKVGQTSSLSSSIPSGSGCAARTFRTSNSNIIKMTRTNWTGEFTAVNPGVAWVTVRTYNGKESSCRITVTK